MIPSTLPCRYSVALVKVHHIRWKKEKEGKGVRKPKRGRKKKITKIIEFESNCPPRKRIQNTNSFVHVP